MSTQLLTHAIMGNRNRNAWNSYERTLAQELRQWFPDCKTSRYASKMLDDNKVDLWGTGIWWIQAKYTQKFYSWNAINNILQQMPLEWWNVVIHKLNNGVGRAKVETVYMDTDTYKEVLKYLGKGLKFSIIEDIKIKEFVLTDHNILKTDYIIAMKKSTFYTIVDFIPNT